MLAFKAGKSSTAPGREPGSSWGAVWSASAIFSHIEHITMAAEAPDLHQGDLGRLEEVRIALNGANIIGRKESKKNRII